MTESGLTKKEIITELTKSPHGKLIEYAKVGKLAADKEPEFFARMIAWNALNGQIRDAKTALPVVSLSAPEFRDEELVENSFAHIAMLTPRELVKAFRFSREVKLPGRMKSMRRLVERYLRYGEAHFSDKQIMQHRRALQELYSLNRTKPSERFQVILNHRALDKANCLPPKGTPFWAVSQLRDADKKKAADLIVKYRIPFLIASGALGDKIKSPELGVAILDKMSPTEFVTNQKLLEKIGVKTVPEVRAAYEQALQRAAKSTQNTLKTTTAIENIEDEKAKEKLRGLQEKQIKTVGGIDGDWLLLVDSSGSMSKAIETGRLLASTLSAMVRGKVYLVFFDATPLYYDVTGMSLDQIKAATKRVIASGCTSIGCGLQYALDAKLAVDGISIVSDGGENTAPRFVDVYQKYVKKFDTDPTVYLYLTEGGDSHQGFVHSVSSANIDMQVFDLRGQKVDAYSIPNLAQTMRASRYSLIDQIMGTPLITLGEVFEHEETLAPAHAG